MIEHVRIQGFKCLRDVSVDLGPFTVLIGPNDSGKTSFLQALRFPWEPNSRNPAVLGELQGDVRVSLESSKVSVRRVLGAKGVAQWSFQPAGGAERPAPDVIGFLEQGVPGPALAHINSPGVDKLVASPPFSLDPARVPMATHSSGRSLDQILLNRGQGVAAHLARLALSDRPRDAEIQRTFTTLTHGRIKEVIVDDTNSSYQLQFRLYDGRVLKAEQISAGLLAFLGYLAVVVREDPPPVLLIEEPENGLHPLRLRELVTLLRTLNERGTQVILTTHSPDLLNACRPEEVRVFTRPEPDSGTQISLLPEEPRLSRILMGLTIGEVWASRGEEGLLDILARPDAQVRAEVP